MKSDILRRLARTFLYAMSLFLATGGNAGNAATNNYPDAPITVVIPWPPGGAADFLGRAVAARMSEKLGQPVIIENRPGADTIIGTRRVASARPDGYTLFLASSGNAVNATLHPETEGNFLQEFVPIINIGVAPTVLVVNPAFPARTVPELLDLLKKNKPNAYTYAFSGQGSASHVSAIQFMRATGSEIMGVSYKGASPATVDLLGGHVDMMFNVVPAIAGHLADGKLHALFALSDKRLAALPDVPTSAEVGFRGLKAGMWHGLAAPAGTPGYVVEKIQATVSEILKEPDIIQKINSQGAIILGTESKAFYQTIKEDTEMYAKLFGSAKAASRKP